MAGASDRNFIILDDWGQHVKLLNGDTALEEGDMVTFSSNVLVEVADSNTVGAIGICAQDIAAGAYGTVYTAGVFQGTAATGTDFGHLDEVFNAGASTLDAGTANDIPVGRVVDHDPASGGAVKFVLLSCLTGDHTAKA